MSIKKANGKWKVDLRPAGRDGPRYRRSFTEKAEATAYAAWITEQHRQQPDWKPEKADGRRFSELVTQWYELYGHNLKDGTGRLAILNALATALGDPVARSLTPEQFIAYGRRRMSPVDDESRPVTPATMNRELSYAKAVFNKLTELKQWRHGNPLESVKAWKTPDSELTYLELDQIPELLAACQQGRNPDTALCAELCLDTGARWREAEKIRVSQIGRQRVTYYNTKGGKQRTVPITADLEKRLRRHAKAQGRADGRVLSSCYSAFRMALKRAGITLPRGQKAHVLRHTFASHFMMNGGNILVLQRILGHSNLDMTLKYAHLAPDYMETVLDLRPLAGATR